MMAVSRILVKEVYYDNDYRNYLTRPLVVMTDRIETIREFYDRNSGAKAKIITMSGDVISCKESFDEIMKKLEGEEGQRLKSFWR